MNHVAPLSPLTEHLRQHGYASADAIAFNVDVFDDVFATFARSWDNLVIDPYMADLHRYRLRRYGRFRLDAVSCALEPLDQKPFFQDIRTNRFAGGIHRRFEPLEPGTHASPLLAAIIRRDFEIIAPQGPDSSASWEVQIHQIRISAEANNKVRPAPEGRHSDGHDFLAMHLIGRENVRGGESRIFDRNQKALHASTLLAPMDSMVLDDRKVMHDVTPLERLISAKAGHRDILLVDFDRWTG